MCFALIIVAMLPLPLVFIARHFNWLPDGSNKLSVSYRKSLTKDTSNLEDETRFILGKNTSETPSPMPSHRAYLGPGSTSPVELITNSTSISGYGSSYQTNPVAPKSESWAPPWFRRHHPPKTGKGHEKPQHYCNLFEAIQVDWDDVRDDVCVCVCVGGWSMNNGGPKKERKKIATEGHSLYQALISKLQVVLLFPTYTFGPKAFFRIGPTQK